MEADASRTGCSCVPVRVAGSQAGGGRTAFPAPHRRSLAGKGMLERGGQERRSWPARCVSGSLPPLQACHAPGPPLGAHVLSGSRNGS